MGLSGTNESEPTYALDPGEIRPPNERRKRPRQRFGLSGHRYLCPGEACRKRKAAWLGASRSMLGARICSVTDFADA